MGRVITLTYNPVRIVTHQNAEFRILFFAVCNLPIPAVLGGLNRGWRTPLPAPPPYSPDQGCNRGRRSLRPPALPFNQCPSRDHQFSPLLGPVSATDRKPQVCFCLTDFWLI